MNQLTNTSGISIAMAVWLAHDEYDNGSVEHPAANLISATALLKPVRQLVLAPAVEAEDRVQDVMEFTNSKMGTAIHDSIEHAWKTGYQASLRKLGYPKKMIEAIRINPSDDELTDGVIPVYLEQRAYRTIHVDGIPITISGKFDQIINGELNDTKTTSVYTYIHRTKTEDYAIQGSIYRWLNPEKITSDVMRIQHIFTDWQRAQARVNPSYPQNRLVEFPVQLMSLQATEAWIVNKIRQIIKNQNLPEPEIVRCTDEELWKSEPVYKYYADPKKAEEGGRSTKNFPNYPAAAAHRAAQGKGVVISVPGEVKACGYCPAYPVCSQRLEYEVAAAE